MNRWIMVFREYPWQPRVIVTYGRADWPSHSVWMVPCQNQS